MNKMTPGVGQLLPIQIGGLLEEINKDIVELCITPALLAVYREIMAAPMYNGKDQVPIHGQTILQIIRNDSAILREEMNNFELDVQVAEIMGIQFFDEESEDDHFEKTRTVEEYVEQVIECGVAMVTSMPYLPQLRQFLRVPENSISASIGDQYTCLVMPFGVPSNYLMEKVLDEAAMMFSEVSM